MIREKHNKVQRTLFWWFTDIDYLTRLIPDQIKQVFSNKILFWEEFLVVISLHGDTCLIW